jgi:hypothetical protein
MKKLAVMGILLTLTVSAHAWDGLSSRATSGRKTVTTPGTAVQLNANSVPCKRIYITALSADVGTVYVGGPDVLAVPAGSTTGTPLTAGQSLIVPMWDLASTYIDSTSASEGVTYTCYQ